MLPRMKGRGRSSMQCGEEEREEGREEGREKRREEGREEGRGRTEVGGEGEEG